MQSDNMTRRSRSLFGLKEETASKSETLLKDLNDHIFDA